MPGAFVQLVANTRPRFESPGHYANVLVETQVYEDGFLRVTELSDHIPLRMVMWCPTLVAEQEWFYSTNFQVIDPFDFRNSANYDLFVWNIVQEYIQCQVPVVQASIYYVNSTCLLDALVSPLTVCPRLGWFEVQFEPEKNSRARFVKSANCDYFTCSHEARIFMLGCMDDLPQEPEIEFTQEPDHVMDVNLSAEGLHSLRQVINAFTWPQTATEVAVDLLGSSRLRLNDPTQFQALEVLTGKKAYFPLGSALDLGRVDIRVTIK